MSANRSQIQRMPKMTCCPIEFQRKFHSQVSSQIVIRVGMRVARPRTKNLRKSPPNVTLLSDVDEEDGPAGAESLS